MFSGYSVGGVGTTLQFGGRPVSFDAGWQTAALSQAPIVCVTHWHMDHVAALFWAANRRAMLNLPAPVVFGSARVVERIHGMMLIASEGSHEIPMDLREISPGEVAQVGRTLIRAFRSVHETPCQGYMVGEERSRLLSEFEGASAQEIGRLRRAGVIVSAVQRVWVAGYTGDTTEQVFSVSPEILECQNLAIECTFVGEGQEALARSRGHMHLSRLREVRPTFPGRLTLVHFSERVGSEERIRVASELGASLLEVP